MIDPLVLSSFTLGTLFKVAGRKFESSFCAGVDGVILEMRNFKKLPLDDFTVELVSGPVSGVSDEE
jgi:hypothetical protein